MLELKPCPFCGGEAELDANRSFREFVSGEISRAVSAYCTWCPAEITVCVPDVPDITPEQVAEMWNQRTESAAVAAEREACAEIAKQVAGEVIGTFVRPNSAADRIADRIYARGEKGGA